MVSLQQCKIFLVQIICIFFKKPSGFSHRQHVLTPQLEKTSWNRDGGECDSKKPWKGAERMTWNLPAAAQINREVDPCSAWRGGDATFLSTSTYFSGRSDARARPDIQQWKMPGRFFIWIPIDCLNRWPLLTSNNKNSAFHPYEGAGLSGKSKIINQQLGAWNKKSSCRDLFFFMSQLVTMGAKYQPGWVLLRQIALFYVFCHLSG